MFPAISENHFSVNSNGGNSSFHYKNFPLTINGGGHRSLSEEEQHLYNHHIIENFVESVREMNDVVLIPSKLKDLDQAQPQAGISDSKYVVLNDDLYSYYQMINVVKNDLFEPHNDESKKSMLFSNPKRKISRREQTKNGHSRNVSSSSLTTLLGNTNGTSNGHRISQDNGYGFSVNGVTQEQTNEAVTSNGTDVQSSSSLVPLTSDQLIGQNSKQLTVQFVHHLHSLYTILDHFTNAADFITERYQKEVEAAM